MPSRHSEQLPAYLLGLLEEEEHLLLEQALATDANLRQELEHLRELTRDWGEDPAFHCDEHALAVALSGREKAAQAARVLGHILECDDCRLVARVLHSQGGPASRATATGSAMPGLFARPRLMLAVAALVVLAFSFGIALRPAAEQGPLRGSLVVDLGASRSGTEKGATLLLSDLDLEAVSLVVETRLPAGASLWELSSRRDGSSVAGGSLEFRPGSSELRWLALPVSAERLQHAGLYVLRIQSADGTVDRAWTLNVLP